ncbi:MAG: TetR/AcrR family transcriptional regulator [Acidimicrobiaceae bacterium]|nr:TetR/AcrR family transcriptional regulator [Acidimicrobiaceae bacterium]
MQHTNVYPRQKREQTRRRLVDAAVAVVRSQGVQGLTLQSVAAEAGLSKGGLLYHFSSKEELVTALLHDAMDRVDKDLKQLVNGGERGAFARAYVEYVRAPDAYWEESATSVFAAAALEPGRLEQVQQLFGEWQTRLIEDDELDPRLALLIRIACDGLWLIDLFGLAPPSDEQRAEVLDFLIQSIELSATPD